MYIFYIDLEVLRTRRRSLIFFDHLLNKNRIQVSSNLNDQTVNESCYPAVPLSVWPSIKSNNKDRIVRAIPIIIYHTIVNYPDLSDSNRPIDTTLNLFDAEMKYLYDNGFKVLTMADLRYDTNSKSLYMKGTS